MRRRRVERDAIVELLFPEGVDEMTRSAIDAIWEEHGGELTPSLIRSIIGRVDQGLTWSPFTVRFDIDELELVEIPSVAGRPYPGPRMYLDRADASVSIQIRNDGDYEPYLSAVLDRYLAPGDVFVDVGANIGYHSLRAAQSVGPQGRVIAAEANVENARMLAVSAAVNGFDQIDVVPLALGRSRGMVAFGPAKGSNGGFLDARHDDLARSRASVVPVVALDDLGLERVDVMKIDVEGAEPAVIAGASATIARCRPVIVVEFQIEMTRRIGRVEPEDYLQGLVDLGYDLFVVGRPGGEAIPVATVAGLLADWGDIGRLEDLLLVPRSLPS